MWDRELPDLKEALLHLWYCLNSNSSRSRASFTKAPQNSEAPWRPTGGECLCIPLIWAWLVYTKSSPWLKKRYTRVGNVDESKKCPEDFPRKRWRIIKQTALFQLRQASWPGFRPVCVPCISQIGCLRWVLPIAESMMTERSKTHRLKVKKAGTFLQTQCASYSSIFTKLVG